MEGAFTASLDKKNMKLCSGQYGRMGPRKLYHYRVVSLNPEVSNTSQCQSQFAHCEFCRRWTIYFFFFLLQGYPSAVREAFH